MNVAVKHDTKGHVKHQCKTWTCGEQRECCTGIQLYLLFSRSARIQQQNKGKGGIDYLSVPGVLASLNGHQLVMYKMTEATTDIVTYRLKITPS